MEAADCPSSRARRPDVPRGPATVAHLQARGLEQPRVAAMPVELGIQVVFNMFFNHEGRIVAASPMSEFDAAYAIIQKSQIVKA